MNWCEEDQETLISVNASRVKATKKLIRMQQRPVPRFLCKAVKWSVLKAIERSLYTATFESTMEGDGKFLQW